MSFYLANGLRKNEYERHVVRANGVGQRTARLLQKLGQKATFKIYISYCLTSFSTLGHVHLLAARISGKGYQVHMTTKKHNNNNNNGAIDDCQLVLICYSDSYLTNEDSKQEAAYALLTANRPAIVVNINVSADNSSPSLLALMIKQRAKIWIDFSLSSQIERVIYNISQHIEQRSFTTKDVVTQPLLSPAIVTVNNNNNNNGKRKRKPLIYISCCWQCRRANDIRLVADLLQKEGCPYSLRLVDDPQHPDQLKKAISDADVVVIFLLSQSYYGEANNNCKNEATIASELTKPILIIQADADDDEAPSWLINAAAAKLTIKDAAFERCLIEAINKCCHQVDENDDNKQLVPVIPMVNVPKPQFYYKRWDGTDDVVANVIREACLRPEKGVRLLTGDDGIGKTTTVANLLHRHQPRVLMDRIDGVIWLNCYGSTQTESGFAERIIESVNQLMSLHHHRQLTSLYDAFDQLRKNSRKMLFVFDDVFDARLLKYFLTCQGGENVRLIMPCLVITRQPFDTQFDETRITPLSDVKMRPWDAGDTTTMLARTFGFVTLLKPDEIVVLGDDTVCCGLPLIATLINGQFNYSEAATAYELVMTSLADISRSNAISPELRRLSVVRRLLRLHLSQITELERRRYLALLLFDPSAVIEAVDAAIIWGLSDNEPANDLLRHLQKRGLVTGDEAKAGDTYCVMLHPLLHEAALEYATNEATYCSNLAVLRFKIVNDGFAWAANSRIREAMPFDIVGRHKRRHLLSHLIGVLNADDLATICTQRSKTIMMNDDCCCFLQFLYNFDNNKWRHFVREIVLKLQHQGRYDLLMMMDNKLPTFRHLVDDNDSAHDEERDEMLLPLVERLRKCRRFEVADGILTASQQSEMVKAALRGSLADVRQFYEAPLVELALAGAILHGHLNIVCWLAESSQQSSFIETNHHHHVEAALRVAARFGYLDVIRYCLIRQQQFRLMSSRRLLSEAASAGCLAVVRFLVEQDASSVGETALASAAVAGHVDVVRWLVDNSLVAVDRSLIEMAACRGQLNVVAYLQDKYSSSSSLSPPEIIIIPTKKDAATDTGDNGDEHDNNY